MVLRATAKLLMAMRVIKATSVITAVTSAVYSSGSTDSGADIGSEANTGIEEASSQDCRQNRMPQNCTVQMNMDAGKSDVIMPYVLATALKERSVS